MVGELRSLLLYGAAKSGKKEKKKIKGTMWFNKLQPTNISFPGGAVLRASVVSYSLRPHATDGSRSESSVRGDSPGKNPRVGSNALLLGIVLTEDPAQISGIAQGFFTV